MQNAAPVRTRDRLHIEPPRNRRFVLLLSTSLNLGLLLFLILIYRKPENVSADNSGQRTVRTDTKPSGARTVRVQSWQQLQSADLSVYAANLRAAGCPEKTVRDILLPLLEEKFRRPASVIFEPTNSWLSFSQRQAAATARTEQQTILRQQQDNTAKELFGFAWTSDGLNQAYTVDTAAALGFLDYDRAEKILCVAEQFKDQFSVAEHSHRVDRRSATYKSWRDEAGSVLSPPEFEEVELRAMLMLYQRRNPTLCKAGLTGVEWRQLMTYRRELCKPFPSALLGDGNELVQEPDSSAEQQFNTKVRLLLGDNRFIDYLKSYDAGVERTLVTLEQLQLPQNLALRLFDLRQHFISRAEEIRQLPVRRAEKRTRLFALRQSALVQLAALNAGPDSPLLNINQEWLQEIRNP